MPQVRLGCSNGLWRLNDGTCSGRASPPATRRHEPRYFFVLRSSPPCFSFPVQIPRARLEVLAAADLGGLIGLALLPLEVGQVRLAIAAASHLNVEGDIAGQRLRERA